MKTRDGIRDCLSMQDVKITKRRAITGICSASANNHLFLMWFGCDRRAKCLVEEHVTSLCQIKNYLSMRSAKRCKICISLSGIKDHLPKLNINPFARKRLDVGKLPLVKRVASASANNLFAHRRFNTGNCVCQKGGVEQLSGCLRVEKRASETTWITEI